MRFLADENVPGPLILGLRRRGHDVVSIRDVLKAAGDRLVLAYAQQESRILLTLDRDFGELAFH